MIVREVDNNPVQVELVHLRGPWKSRMGMGAGSIRDHG